MNIPMSNVSTNISVDQFVIAETVKLNFRSELVLSGEFAAVDPKATVLEAAKAIVDGDWYVTASERNEGPGGIEVVNYALNVRVKDSAISAAKKKLDDVNTRKGLRFELATLDYAPTKKQLEEANKDLRKKIYERAIEEVTILNESLKDDSGESWIVGTVQFGAAPHLSKSVRSAATMYNSASVFNESHGGNGEDEDAGITQKVELSANVVFTRKIYSRV